MKNAGYLWTAILVCVVLIAVLFWQVARLHSQLSSPRDSSVATLQPLLTRLQADIDNFEGLAAGSLDEVAEHYE